jgi:RimJ/RimL family protein N-acetyltransferase
MASPCVEYVFIHQLSEAQYIELYHIVSNPETMQWIGNGLAWTPGKLLETRNFSAKDYTLPQSARKYFYWAILRNDGKTRVIGFIGLHPAPEQLQGLQIVYAIAPGERGHGYAAQAIRDILGATTIGQSLSTRTIYAIARKENKASIKTITSSGLFSLNSDMPMLNMRGYECAVFKKI